MSRHSWYILLTWQTDAHTQTGSKALAWIILPSTAGDENVSPAPLLTQTVTCLSVSCPVDTSLKHQHGRSDEAGIHPRKIAKKKNHNFRLKIKTDGSVSNMSKTLKSAEIHNENKNVGCFSLVFFFSHSLMMMVILFLCDHRKDGFHQVKDIDPTNHSQHLECVIWSSFLMIFFWMMVSVIIFWVHMQTQKLGKKKHKEKMWIHVLEAYIIY